VEAECVQPLCVFELAFIAASSRCGVGAERKTLTAVAPAGFMVVDDHLPNAVAVDVLPILIVCLAVRCPKRKPNPRRGDMSPRRNRVGDVRQHIGKRRRDGHENPLEAIVVRAIGLRKILDTGTTFAEKELGTV
jgi:hypothetical protein